MILSKRLIIFFFFGFFVFLAIANYCTLDETGNSIFFFVLSVVILIFYAVGIWIRGTLGINMITISIGFWIVLTAFDCYYSVFSSSRVIPKPKDFDKRTTFQVVYDLRHEGNDAYPFYPPRSALNNGDQNTPLSLGGITKALTVYCNELGEYLVYDSDRYGFNNPDNVWDHRIDAMLIGDSFAQGACVPASESIAAKLRKKNLSIASLGAGGNGPLLELASLVEFAKPVKPKYVFWLYYEGNDLNDLFEERRWRNGFLINYLEKDFQINIKNRQMEIDKKRKAITNKSYASKRKALNGEIDIFSIKDIKFLYWGSLRRHIDLLKWAEKKNVLHEPDFKLFRKILYRAKTVIKNGGGQLIFVYLPAYKSYLENKEHRGRRRVLELIRELDLPLVDIYSVFKNGRDPISLFPFRSHGHYTPDGYNIVANELFRQTSRLKDIENRAL